MIETQTASRARDAHPVLSASRTDRAPMGKSLHPAVASITSALLLWFAFPPADRGYLAWFALAPLLLLVRRSDTPKRLYAGAWLGGLVFWLFAVEWVRLADPSAWLAWFALATVLSLWWPLFLVLARLATLHLKLPLMLGAPIIWVALEFARARLFTGFPMYNLAHTQYRYLPLIQISDLTGAWGLSWLILAVNAWWVELVSLPLRRFSSRGPRVARSQVIRGLVVAGLFLATTTYGVLKLRGSNFRPGPRIAVVQTDVPQEYKQEGRDPGPVLSGLEALVAQAAYAQPRPDLVIWPETSFPFGFTTIDPTLSETSLARQARSLEPDRTVAEIRKDQALSAQYLHDWADKTGVSMLVGTAEHALAPGGPFRYNSSVLFEPRVSTEKSYHKRHLVPFGEYLPISWLQVFTPYEEGRVPNLNPGQSSVPLRFGPWRIAEAICFEDTLPQVVRAAFNHPGVQPDFLVNQSNDGWFRGSSEHEVHLAISVFRAVENRAPIARSANRGISALIDGNGAILATIPKLRASVLSMQIPLDDRTSAYSRWGDWFGAGCLAITIGFLPQAAARHFRRSP
jgi:apolipoprotein N-acyltransferase